MVSLSNVLWTGARPLREALDVISINVDNYNTYVGFLFHPVDTVYWDDVNMKYARLEYLISKCDKAGRVAKEMLKYNRKQANLEFLRDVLNGK